MPRSRTPIWQRNDSGNLKEQEAHFEMRLERTGFGGRRNLKTSLVYATNTYKKRSKVVDTSSRFLIYSDSEDGHTLSLL
ncbi:hypothetical protein VNI00_016797 [Paramarasmius palmivorus]|uniref:Uncharacterized protein n=1 Tax=Paramarasmius palmivorus TaxID=297713 RepID=A0AAW0BCT2_9AGAR